MAEVVDVAVGAQAADDGAARWGGYTLALGSDGDLAVIADADFGLLAPDIGPPRARGHGAQDGALLRQGLLACGVGRHPQFAVEFVVVGVGEELVEQVVGPFEFEDVVGGQEGREAFLPVVVAAFDFAFGLRGGGVAQGDAVEVEGGAELGVGVGGVGEEEGVVVHIEHQGQAMGLEGAGEEVEVGQEGFTFVEAGAGVVAGGVVEEVQEALFGGGAGEEGVRGGVVLPEGTEVAGLPAFDGFGRGLVAGVGGELVGEGPAADAGAVGCKLEAAVEFAGGGAVGGGGLGGEEFGEQGGGVGGPVGLVVAAGVAGGPGVGVALGAGAQVVAVEFVEAGPGEAQFGGGLDGGEFRSAVAGQEMTDDGGWEAVDQLEFFMGVRLKGWQGFCALELAPAGACRAAVKRPGLPFARLQTALRLRPRRALSSAEATAETIWPCRRNKGRDHYSPFDRTGMSPFDRTTTQKVAGGHRG